MQTQIADSYRNTPDGEVAERILRSCVHCGFCLATCPTYQVLGNELDSPRGRIYLMKQVLEGATPTAKTQLHLDRCLTCRNCETTCPSGVEYGKLLDIGRHLVEDLRQLVHHLVHVELRLEGAHLATGDLVLNRKLIIFSHILPMLFGGVLIEPPCFGGHRGGHDADRQFEWPPSGGHLEAEARRIWHLPT